MSAKNSPIKKGISTSTGFIDELINDDDQTTSVTTTRKFKTSKKFSTNSKNNVEMRVTKKLIICSPSDTSFIDSSQIDINLNSNNKNRKSIISCSNSNLALSNNNNNTNDDSNNKLIKKEQLEYEFHLKPNIHNQKKKKIKNPKTAQQTQATKNPILSLFTCCFRASICYCCYCSNNNTTSTTTTQTRSSSCKLLSCIQLNDNLNTNQHQQTKQSTNNKLNKNSKSLNSPSHKPLNNNNNNKVTSLNDNNDLIGNSNNDKNSLSSSSNYNNKKDNDDYIDAPPVTCIRVLRPSNDLTPVRFDSHYNIIQALNNSNGQSSTND